MGKGKEAPVQLPPTPAPTPEPVTFPLEMTEANLLSCFNARVCIHCGAEDMIYSGPHGGASQNFGCGCCGQKVNMLVINHQAIWGQEIGHDQDLRQRYDAEGRTIIDRVQQDRTK
jgi:hypothetical protein